MKKKTLKKYGKKTGKKKKKNPVEDVAQYFKYQPKKETR
jgi:hypothetical protein